MKVAIRSDYIEGWEFQFDRLAVADVLFERLSTTTRHRREDHRDLAAAGFLVPMRGTVGKLLGELDPKTPIVVYTDPTSHRGEGKRLVYLHEATRLYGADAYAAQFVGRPLGGTSYRMLMVGTRVFWLKYTQKRLAEWRSNVGDVDIEFERPMAVDDMAGFGIPRAAMEMGYPLIGIDFVAHENKLWALDLNTAPGIKGSPVADVLSDREIYELIVASIGEGRRRNTKVIER